MKTIKELKEENELLKSRLEIIKNIVIQEDDIEYLKKLIINK